MQKTGIENGCHARFVEAGGGCRVAGAAEEGSAFGYADAIIETRKFVWVFEFKFNKSAGAAIRQIREKGYADQYKGDKRPVTLVGINFRSAKRNIDEPVFEALRG